MVEDCEKFRGTVPERENVRGHVTQPRTRGAVLDTARSRRKRWPPTDCNVWITLPPQEGRAHGGRATSGAFG